MQTNFEKISTTLGKFTVEIVEDDYKKEVDKKIKEYSKTAQVKGFRPGHVPLQYIKNLYGKGILIDEVIKVASGAVNNCIKENELNVVGEPTPKENSYEIDWTKQTEYKFDYEIGFASDFKVDVDKLPEITVYEIEPSEEQVNQSIEDVKIRFGKDSEPEEAELGDLVFGTLAQSSTEFFFQSGIPTDKVKVDSQYLFKGLEKGSSINFDIQSIFETDKELGFATGKSDEDAAALNGEFEFKVEKITRKLPADLDQEFFDKVLGPEKAKDETEFRAQVKSLIAENYKRESEFLLSFDIEKSLLENCPIELPNEFLTNWLVEVNEGKATKEDVEKEFEAIARGLRLDLIKAEIAKQNELKVEYADMLEEVKNEIRGYFGQQGGFEGMEDFIDNMAKKQLEDKSNAENSKKYFEKAFGRKVMDFVATKVKTNSKPVQVDEFKKIAEESYKM